MSALTFAELRRINVARCTEAWKHPLDSWTIADWLVAIGGEAGEALNLVKKLNRERDGIIGNSKAASDLLDDLADELADGVIYADLTLARLDASLSPRQDIVSFGSFAEFNRSRFPYGDEGANASTWGLVILEALGMAARAETEERLALSLRLVVGAMDLLAQSMNIDLGAAVSAKFNATSIKHGFPHRLGAEVGEAAL